MKTLVAYFSRAGENYFNGAIKPIEVGNTQLLAEEIAKQVEGELFPILPVTPYSEDYNQCLEEAKCDQKRGARPEFQGGPESLAEYEEIYLGYPNYWGTMPMVLFTFLERYDWSGKTIHPFCTHEGGGAGHSISDIRRLATGADIKEELCIRGAEASRSKDAVASWL